MATKFIQLSNDLSGNVGDYVRVNIVGNDSYLVDNLYLSGSKDTENSIRFAIETDTGFAEIQKFLSGVWQPASLETGPNSLWLGERVGLAAGGDNLITEDSSNNLGHTFVHTHFNGALSTSRAKIITAYQYVVGSEKQPLYDEEKNSTEIAFYIQGTTLALLNQVSLKTGSTAPTAPIRVRVYRGQDATGPIIFDQTYPISNFPISSDISLTADSYLTFGNNESGTPTNYYVRFTSSQNFSLLGHTFPQGFVSYLKLTFSEIREDDILQTNQWVNAYPQTIANQQWTIPTDGKVRVYKGKTETFIDTYENRKYLYDVITSEDFPVEEVIANKILNIPQNKQMLIFGTFILSGEMELNGTLVLRD